MRKRLISMVAIGIMLTACVGSTGGEGVRAAPDNRAATIKEEGADVSRDAADLGKKDTDQTEEKRETLDTEVTAAGEIGNSCVGKAKEIFEATNAERIDAGLTELVWNEELAKAADLRAGEIINDFDHVRPDGTKCYVLSKLIHGENIARGPHAAGKVYVAGWMGSEGHRANILCDRYTLIGVGTKCTEYGDTAVQIFGYDD